VYRAILLATLAFAAASCGGSGSSEGTTSSATPAATTAPVTISSAHPRADALAAVRRCRAAFAAVRIGTVAKANLQTAKAAVAKAKTACGDAATLRAIANANPNDSALKQARDAEVAVNEGLVNFAYYLGHVADGTNGQKIFDYSTEQLRQARILLDDAFGELQ
jgi:hypothetical protein